MKSNSTVVSPLAMTVCLVPLIFSLLSILPSARGFVSPQNGRFQVPSTSVAFIKRDDQKQSSSLYEAETSITSHEFEIIRVEFDRRLLLSQIKLFQNLNEGDIARLSIMAKPIDVNAGEDIFAQGDKADEAYVISSGSFECYDKVSGTIYATFGRGQLFGEVAIIKKETRALSVRSNSSSDGVLLQLTKEDLRLALSSSTDSVDSILEAEYFDYFDVKKRANALKKCPLFKQLSEDDFGRMQDAMYSKSYSKNEELFQKGEEGDSMYFIKSGNFGCLDEKGNIVTSIKEGGYVGELSILLDQNRALTVKALEDGEVYCLLKEDFIKCVKDSELFDSAIESIKERYGLRTIWDVVSTLTFEELRNLAVVSSRGKKAMVSKHSTLSTIATGFFLAAMISMLSPGFYPNGFPRLYDEMLFDNVELTRITTFLFAVIGVTGVFRLPPKAPPLRRLLFEQSAWLCIFAWMCQDSNLNITSGAYTFDYLQPIPALAFIAVLTMLIINNMQCIVEAISGPIKRRQSLLLSSNTSTSRVMETFGQFATSLGIVNTFPIAFMVRDGSILNSIYYPGIVAIDGMSLTADLTTSVFIGFGMLICTLLYEKKLNHKQALLSMPVLLVLSGMYDSIVPTFNPEVLYNIKPDMMPTFLNMLDLGVNTWNEFHVIEIYAALIGTSIAIGLFKLTSKGAGIEA
eukprot:CAMPEP_0198273940 /NCGR_PEP_ID=MMETSP1447-20131203/58495_1 /TAXON_ID=420782 /ORGANISM="Chaetoceros dichaeta, Strain CCMP1751" /LENGTH=686 /DNA_ID=CAMNT_0043967835 /DNA_START=97 /DNA_END=2157 /DNA_ORIENTATION=+